MKEERVEKVGTKEQREEGRCGREEGRCRREEGRCRREEGRCRREEGRYRREGGRKVQKVGRKGNGYRGREQGCKESRKRDKVWLSQAKGRHCCPAVMPIFLACMKQLGLLLLPQDGMLVH